MSESIIVTLAFPGRPLSRVLLLLDSLRERGGLLAGAPAWIIYPVSLGTFNDHEKKILAHLNGDLRPVDIDPALLAFPLGAKVQAAAVAEALMERTKQQLIWLDEDTLVLSALDEFVLPPGKVFGYRPVHHQLLGTGWKEEPQGFWQLVYQHCGASFEKDFPMETHAGERIRPYFNAGCYALRPEQGILREWWRAFQSAYQDQAFQIYFEQDPLYAVFLHQAILTGVILSSLEEDQMVQLSPSINYPLHLHEDLPPSLRPTWIDDLTTVRYERLLEEPGWDRSFPISPGLGDWIKDRFQSYQNLREGR